MHYHLSGFPCVSQDLMASFKQTSQKGRKVLSSYMVKEKERTEESRLAHNPEGLHKYNPQILTGEDKLLKDRKRFPQNLKHLGIRKIKRHKP